MDTLEEDGRLWYGQQGQAGVVSDQEQDVYTTPFVNLEVYTHARVRGYVDELPCEEAVRRGTAEV